MISEKVTLAEPRISLFPRPVVVVTAIGQAPELGATTVSWTGIVSSRPPVVAVSFLPDSYTRRCITRSREFVINVPDGTLVEETNLLGSVSGDWQKKAEVMREKLGRELHLEPSTSVRTPVIAEFYLNLECRCLSTVQVGLYDVFLGEVLQMQVKGDLLSYRHPRGEIDHRAVQPLLCLADEYWSGGTALGRSTENKEHPHGRQH